MRISEGLLVTFPPRSKLRNSTEYWSPTCWEGWRKTWSSPFHPYSKPSSTLRWQTFRRPSTRPSMKRIRTCWQKVSPRPTPWTQTWIICRFSWGNAAITPFWWAETFKKNCWRKKGILLKMPGKLFWTQVERQYCSLNYSRSSKSRARRPLSSRSSSACFSSCTSTSKDLDLAARSFTAVFQHPVGIGQFPASRKEMSMPSWYRLRREEWGSTWPLQQK